MITRILFLTVAVALALGSPAEARDIKGKARVVDGDTLYVGQVKIRLNGIDAPERGQARFRAATQALRSFVAGKVVICRLNGDTSYDRYIGSCYVDGFDVAASVIATGNALDCPRYSGGRYRRYETEDARRYIRQAPYC
jgi:endonuclease YncB( thermonuclease family)